MEGQVVEADTSNPLLRVLEVNRTAEGQVGRFNHFTAKTGGHRVHLSARFGILIA